MYTKQKVETTIDFFLIEMSFVRRAIYLLPNFLTKSYFKAINPLKNIASSYLFFHARQREQVVFSLTMRWRESAICWPVFSYWKGLWYWGWQLTPSPLSAFCSVPGREALALHASHQVWIPRFTEGEKRTLVQAAF